MLCEKHGVSIVDGLLDGSSYRATSKWWKDVNLLEGGNGDNWFNSEMVRKVANGRSTSFWNVAWKGGIAFCNKYPRLFSLSGQQNAQVKDLWTMDGGGEGWSFLWQRRLFVWEEALLTDLREGFGNLGVREWGG